MLWYIGLVVAVYLLLRILLFTWKMFRLYVLTLFEFTKDLRSYGKWAVVTGSTDGIGKAYAVELARRGLHIVLVGRTQSKLDGVKQLLEEQAPPSVQSKTICFDFADRTADYQVFQDELGELDVGVLVNCAGMAYGGKWSAFADSDLSKSVQIIDVNMTSLVSLTHVVMQGMKERKRGILIHISSGSTGAVIPFINLYAASKTFVNYFSRMLNLESSSDARAIEHQLIIPNFVATKMSRKRPSFFCPSAEAYGRSAVDLIGLSEEAAGYWNHEIANSVLSAMPRWLLNFMMNQRKPAAKKTE